MPESMDLYAEVAKLRDEVEDVNEMVQVLVRVGGDEEKKKILGKMRKDAALAEVFLLVDGSRSQTEILKDLQKRGIPGASSATVSRKLEVLHKEHHLIHFVRRTASGNVYRLTRLAQVYDLGRALKKGK
jgi:hypothetical protein